MKTYHCSRCGRTIMDVENGSKIQLGIMAFCKNCSSILKLNEFASIAPIVENTKQYNNNQQSFWNNNNDVFQNLKDILGFKD